MSVYDREPVDRVRAALDVLWEASSIFEVRGPVATPKDFERLNAARHEALCALGDS
jgi:hypothetical protein